MPCAAYDGQAELTCLRPQPQGGAHCVLQAPGEQDEYRLFHLEDTCLMDQMKLVEEFAKELLESKLIVSGEELSMETDGLD